MIPNCIFSQKNGLSGFSWCGWYRKNPQCVWQHKFDDNAHAIKTQTKDDQSILIKVKYDITIRQFYVLES